MRKYSKFFAAQFYLLKIGFKKRFVKRKLIEFGSVETLLLKYGSKKKIVVLGNGPSANLFKPSKDVLYLVTNSGKKLVDDFDYLYYVGDPFFTWKVLANPNFFKRKVEMVFYYNNSDLHKKGIHFLMKNIGLLKEKHFYFLTSELEDSNSLKNYNDFISFYTKRNLKVKVQNSGMFILLFGYYLSQKLQKPMEVYGLDMGEGGRTHFDGKGIITDCVVADRVKKNIKMYLDFFYEESASMIKNYSYFNPKLN